MTINEAIFTVLTTQFKKDAPEAFKMVESLPGCRVDKYQGSFDIRNTETNRWISGRQVGWRGYYICLNNTKIEEENAKKIDFYGFLFCERKRYYEPYIESEAIKKYKELKSKKWSVDYAIRDLEETRKKIARLQSDLERYVLSKYKREEELEKYRKEIGLKERR